MMIKTLHVCMHVSMCSCMDGWLHMSKGVQACRPAYMHACMCKHMQVHIQPDIQKRLYPLVFTMIDHDDQNPSCMHACQHLLMHGWLVTHKQRCTSMQTSIQTCICAWTHAGTYSLLEKRLYPLVLPWSIMMIKILHVRTHARVCLCVDRCLHISKGVQACRPACTHVCMCEHTHIHKAWWWGGYNRSLGTEVKAVISAYFTMIDHDDQNPSCMHACQHVLARGWLVTHEQRCMSKQNSMQTCAVAWMHAGMYSLRSKRL